MFMNNKANRNHVSQKLQHLSEMNKTFPSPAQRRFECAHQQPIFRSNVLGLCFHMHKGEEKVQQSLCWCRCCCSLTWWPVCGSQSAACEWQSRRLLLFPSVNLSERSLTSDRTSETNSRVETSVPQEWQGSHLTRCCWSYLQVCQKPWPPTALPRRPAACMAADRNNTSASAEW